MMDKHIISLLDNAPHADLSESELATIHCHIGLCTECRKAFEAATVSSHLLRERVAETFEPSPFFQTRVLAAIRERQAASEVPVFQRLWRTAGALVSSMAAVVVAMAALTFFAPGTTSVTTTSQVATTSSSYSAEDVIFDQRESTESQMSYEQVLATLYDAEENR